MENFYTLYGEDKALVKYECNQLLQTFSNCDIVKYDMLDMSIEDVVDDARTVGMFTEKKVIVLEDAFFLMANKSVLGQEKLEYYIEHYNPSNILVFLVFHEKIDTRKKINKLLSKHKVIEVKKKDQENLKKYALEYLKKNGYKMQDIDYFLSKVGSSLPNINNELDKLMMYKFDDKYIDNNDVDRVSVFTSEEEIFALTDSIVAKDTLNSLNLLEEFLKRSYDEMQIIMLLASQFRFFFQVKRLMNQNKSESDIAKILEVNPYRVKFTVKKLYTYTESMLLQYIKKLARMDHDIKLGLMDKRLALELFVTMNG